LFSREREGEAGMPLVADEFSGVVALKKVLSTLRCIWRMAAAAAIIRRMKSF
jgi:hypothetical protein